MITMNRGADRDFWLGIGMAIQIGMGLAFFQLPNDRAVRRVSIVTSLAQLFAVRCPWPSVFGSALSELSETSEMSGSWPSASTRLRLA